MASHFLGERWKELINWQVFELGKSPERFITWTFSTYILTRICPLPGGRLFEQFIRHIWRDPGLFWRLQGSLTFSLSIDQARSSLPKSVGRNNWRCISRRFWSTSKERRPTCYRNSLPLPCGFGCSQEFWNKSSSWGTAKNTYRDTHRLVSLHFLKKKTTIISPVIIIILGPICAGVVGHRMPHYCK